MSRLLADALLVLCALIWGTTFLAQKNAAAVANPLAFVALRFAISGVLLVPLAWIEAHVSRPRPRPRRGDWWLAAAVGASLLSAASLQQLALTSTSVTHGGFLTAAYVVCVPWVGWLLLGHRPRSTVLIACGVTLAGAWLLTSGDAPAPGAATLGARRRDACRGRLLAAQSPAPARRV